ncbi:hypothetical protein LT85_p001 (plasmid) [Collimonas arenae]|uniref:Uncharacterized protein n=1 Tax=Collimonas arenae TaxID=279058 RepID=A0A0A1FKC6_9BURK|nr:hypothetical protein [Collimonas arenae]AIY44180.1 hypothetical protein LT85_p001 [Collimonas arenae]
MSVRILAAGTRSTARRSYLVEQLAGAAAGGGSLQLAPDLRSEQPGRTPGAGCAGAAHSCSSMSVRILAAGTRSTARRSYLVEQLAGAAAGGGSLQLAPDLRSEQPGRTPGVCSDQT